VAFSLIELVIVVAIIAILAAVAIPRFTRGSARAGSAALQADLRQLRSAITIYAVEHNNTWPGPDAASFPKCLTSYTDLAGNASPTKTGTYRFGPYLLAVPPCPVGENAGGPRASEVLISTDSPPKPSPTTGEGWVYNPATGEILPNTDMVNEEGTKFIEAEAQAVVTGAH
jgi:prepilin-type N-terminal cleavage/methylation domain-containing protein